MRLLIVDNLHPYLVTELKKMGWQCDIETALDKIAVERKIAGYHGIVIRSKFEIDSSFIDKAVNLKFIARAGAGMENIDVEYAKRKNIACVNSPEGNRDAVAEHALGMILALLNKIPKADQEIRKGIWNREGNWGTSLCGKTVGIIGYGYMGEAFSKRLSGFDVKIIAYDKYKTGFSNEYVKEVSLKQIMEEADVLSLHIPLTEETTCFVNQLFISAFKKAFYLINTSRGQNVETKSLVEALQSGKILGACLDVLEYENFSFESIFTQNESEDLNFLLHSDRVILSPHIAGWTDEAYRKHSEVLLEKIKRIS